MWRFYLQFRVDHEFWEVARVIAEAKEEGGVRAAQITDLVCGALDTVPTVRHSPPHPHIAVNPHESGEDIE